MSNDDSPTPEPDRPPDASPTPTPGTQPEPPAAPTPPPSGYEVPSAPTQPYAAPGYAPSGQPPPGHGQPTFGQPGAEQPGAAGYPHGQGYPPAPPYPEHPGGAYPPGAYPPQYPTYPQSPYSPGPPQGGRTDGVSIAALVTGLLGLGLVPLVLGIIGLGRTTKHGTQGRGFAITGIILGALAIVASIVFAIGAIVSIAAYHNRMDDLRSDCANGVMAACDDLYDDSLPGSDDKEFGDTCGGRTDGGYYCKDVDPSRGTFGDHADLDVLWNACIAGDRAACTRYGQMSIDSADNPVGTVDGNRVGFTTTRAEVTG